MLIFDSLSFEPHLFIIPVSSIVKLKLWQTDTRVLKGANTLKSSYKLNLIDRSYYKTKEYKSKLSTIAKQRGLGGYQENAGRNKKFKVLDSLGKQVCLQSTYELLCSKILDKNGIKWIRPKSLKYENKNYFPDFYLLDYNIYLDPKNDYKAKCDTEKIRKVIDENNVKLYVLLKTQLNENYILSLLK